MNITVSKLSLDRLFANCKNDANSLIEFDTKMMTATIINNGMPDGFVKCGINLQNYINPETGEYEIY